MKKLSFLLAVLLACGGPDGQGRVTMTIGAKDDAAEPPSKVALIIGNANYKFSPLRNPVTDAKDMARALADAGFEVTCRTDLTQNEMKQAIRAFGERIRQGAIGLFYYAGHAVQVDGRNYLIPVGAEITREQEIEYEAVDIGFLLSQMQDAGNPLNIVILDACRNNPFGRSFRSGSQGLASINAPSGTLIAYATAPGSVASDGEGQNGLYTQELLKAMREPGLKIEEVFKRVRSAVLNMTRGKQTPWESSSLVGDFYFSAGGKAVKAIETAIERNPPDSTATSTAPPKSPPPEPATNRSPLSATAAEVFINQGDAAAKQKQWSEAEIEYRQAIDLIPNNAKLRAKLGDVLAQQKKWDGAAAQYAEAVRLDPQNKSYQDRLAAARSRSR